MAGQWYIQWQEQQPAIGPITDRELKDFADRGGLLPKHCVRQGLEGQWVKAASVRGLFWTEQRAGLPSPPPSPVAHRESTIPSLSPPPSIASPPAVVERPLFPQLVKARQIPSPPPTERHPALQSAIQPDVHSSNPFAPQSTHAVLPTTAMQINVMAARGSSHSLGVASLVVGILALFVCWVPVIGLLLGGLGLLLGIGGLFVAIVRHGSGIGYAIAGAAMSTLCMPIALFSTTVLMRVVDHQESRMPSPPSVSPLGASKPSANDFQIVSFHAVGSNGGLRAVGEIRNKGQVAASPKVEVIARDANGQAVDSCCFWPSGVSDIPPGHSSGIGYTVTHDPRAVTLGIRVIDANVLSR
jgi:hypothetical protein